MSDVVDRANSNNETQLARQIAAQRAQKTEPCHVIGDIHYCIDCDAEINPERIKQIPNAARCIDCQSIKEMKDKHFA